MCKKKRSHVFTVNVLHLPQTLLTTSVSKKSKKKKKKTKSTAESQAEKENNKDEITAQ